MTKLLYVLGAPLFAVAFLLLALAALLGLARKEAS